MKTSGHDSPTHPPSCAALDAPPTAHSPPLLNLLTITQVIAAGPTEPGTSHAPIPSTHAPAAAALKQQLRAALEGLDRGIFGTTAAQRAAVLALVAQLEALNPVAAPLRHMDQLEGDWQLLYTTIAITVRACMQPGGSV